MSGQIAGDVWTKYEALRAYLGELSGAVVAFSGGVDSTFLLKAAQDVLGERVVAVTAVSPFVPPREVEEAKAFCEAEGIRHILYPFDALSVENVRKNSPRRCYFCKYALFGNLIGIAAEHGMKHVLEGSNRDDAGDYRPGLQAIEELSVKSPLWQVGLWKAEIRELSREMGLPTWEKPSFACLASRLPYGEELTEEKLAMVDRGEQLLLDKGFRQVRLRLHGDLARVEVLPDAFGKLLEAGVREAIVKGLKECGFRYVTMDLQGYRSGSMNEVL